METGFYWVKKLESWSIAYWDRYCGTWHLCGVGIDIYSDDFFDEIDKERIIEKHQMLPTSPKNILSKK